MATAVPQQARAETSQQALPVALRWLLAIVAPAAALVLTLAIRRLTGSPTFFSFYIAIFISVWFGGRGAGSLSAILAALILHSFFHGPADWTSLTWDEIPTFLAFIMSAATADVLSSRRYRTENALRAARDRLELSVQERTAELRQTNEALAAEIVERARAEEALRASELRWRRMYEASSAGMALIGLDGFFIAANAAFQKMVDYSEDELRKLSAVDITHADDKSATVNVIAEFGARLRYEYHVEKRYLRKDGRPVWLNATTTLVPGTDRTPSHLQAILIDITERKRADAALLASEERWRRLFEASSAGMSVADLTSRYVATNAAFQSMLGYSDDELKALSAIEITHPDERATTREIVAEFVSCVRKEYHADKRYMKKDGTPLWANVTTTYVPPTDATPAMLQNIYINIDDRKRAEQALRVSEERWRTVFETSSVGIATSDENLHVATANAAFQRMVGYTESELREMRWIDLSHEDDRGATEDLVRSLLDGRLLAYNMEKRYRRKDGETIWVNVYNTLVPATASTPAFFPAIIVDITDRIHAEGALQRSQAELARVARVTTMGELATSIAHEINQPLAAIVASGNACRRWLEGQNLSRAKESLERVIADADRACEVIKRVRSLTSKAAPEQLELNINSVVEEVLAVTRGELQARQVSLQLQLNDAVPPVRGDKVQLQQVVLNLVMNAIEAMAAITERRRVLSINSQPGEDGGAQVTVEDCGSGLAPRDAERIFQPFFTTKAGGIGMGLSISSSIIEAHGGRLWASPAPPCGAAFHFSLPEAKSSET